ncbi:ankyrin repeat domain-containing protein 26-like [Ursus arctos]|uniref:ankyrin repeat domain-containing protein 26-like n=1 Tax=Ursus arctos TaxID=9644 RepID=UPI00254800AD|nr:ankyrin repeat domain-containing protein 26-like [Ursus arctos]
MKKLFSFGDKSSLPVTSSLRDGFGLLRREKRTVARSSREGYTIRDKDLRNIHRAACLGDVEKVHHLAVVKKNSINSRDKMHRTALHLACATGHPDVVSFLADRNCQLNLYDQEARTPLMKAVQCQEESCVTILLEHGADPNCMDYNGNTALHYAAAGQNVSIVEKLLSYDVDIEGRNKEDLTPFLVAVAGNKQQVVEFLMERGANIHAIDIYNRTALMLAVTYECTDIVKLLLQKGINISLEAEWGWTAEEYATINGFNVIRQLIAEHREAIRAKNCSQNRNPAVDESSEDTSSRLSVYRGDENARPTSVDGNVNIKNVPKQSLRNLMAACEKFKNLETKPGLMTVGDNLSLTDDNSDHKDEDTKVHDLFCPAIPSPRTLKKPLMPLAGLPVTKDGEVLSAIGEKDNGIDMESAPREQTVNDSLTSADRASKNNGDAVDESSEDTLSSLSVCCGGDDSWPTSDDDDFNIKNVPKPSLIKLMAAYEKIKNLETKPGLMTVGDNLSLTDDNSDHKDGDTKVHDLFCPAIPSTRTLKKPLMPLAGLGVTKDGEVLSAIGKKDNGIDMESAPQGQTVNDNLTSADRASKNNGDVMVIGLGEEEDRESPWDSEDGEVLSAIGKKDNGIDMESAPQGQTVNDNLTSAARASKNNGDVMVIGLGEEEDRESPWDSEDGEVLSAIGEKDNGIDMESAPQGQTVNDNLTSAARASKNNRDVMVIGLGEEEDRESPWDSEDGEVLSAIGKKDNGIDMESAPQGQTVNDNLTSAARASKNNGDVMVIGLGEEEDRESPWDSEDGEVLSAIGKKDNGIDMESAPQGQTVNDNLTSAARASKNNGDVMVIGLGEEEDRESPWHSEDGEVLSAIGKKDNGIDMESAPQGQTVNDNLTSAARASKNNGDVMVIGLGEEEDRESPWHSEDGEVLSAIGEKDNGIDMKSAPREQTVNDNLTSADRASKNNGDVMVIGLGEEEDRESPWDSEPIIEVKASVRNKTIEIMKKDTSKSDLSAERNLEMTSEEEQETQGESENNHLQDKVILQTCILAEKTSENQIHQGNIPLLHLQKMAQEPEMNKKCDREDDLSVYSVHPSVQKDEKMWNRKGKLEWKTNVKLITSKLKRKFGAICKKDKITTYPKEESRHGNFKEGANLKEIPSHLTNDGLGCEKKDAFAVPVPVVFQAFPEQKEPSVKKVILSRPNSGSLAYACQSSSNISSSGNKSDCENGTLDIEHVFNKNEGFDSDTENKNVRNPLVTFEVKEDQEFDMGMSASMNQNSTNCKLDVGCIPPSSDLRRLFDFWLACFHEMRQMVQMKRHNISAVTNTYKKTKDSFQKPLNADNDSTNNYRSMEPELEHVSSSPSCSYRTSEVYRSEGLQPDILKCVNEMGLLLVEFVSLENENVQLQKEMVEERKRHESDKLAVSESIYAAAATGLIQQRASGKTDNHLCPIMEDEDSDGPAKKTSKDKKEIKKQINFTDDLDDLTPLSGTASEDCKLPCFDFRSCMLLIEQLGMDCKDSVNLLKIRNAVCSFERLLELKNDHCEQLTRKIKELEDSVNGLQKELSQTKEIKLQLEQQKVEWEQELCSLRFSFKREKEKRRNTDMLYEKNKEQLKRTVQQYNKEAELKQQLEVTLRTQDEELRSVRNNLNQMVEERKRHESDKLAVSESIYAAAATGLIQQRASGKTDNHLCPIMEDEDSDGPAKKTSKEKKEIKKQINFTDDLDDLTPLSGTASEDCKLPCFDFRSCMLLIEQLGMDCKDSVNLLKIQNVVCSFERLLELKNDHCEQLTRKNKELEDSVNGLQKELSQTKEIKLQLEQQKVEWEQELCSLRFSFKREKEKRRNTDMLYEKIKEQLKRTVQQYNKEAELKQQLEVTLRTQDEELRSVRNNLNQMVEERKRHESDKLAVSESIYAAAATGLIQQRASGKTDNHLCPIMEDEDSDGPAKKTSKEKKEIKKQINFTDDLDDLTPLSGTASEDCKLPCFDFRSCMLLIEQLGMDCKDSVNLLKIRNAVCSFERLLELKNDHCEQLTRKNKELEDSVNGLQKELSQTKEIKLQLEQQKVEWEQERCSLRPAKKTSKEKKEIKKQINFTDDLDDLTPLSGTASEDCKLPCFDFRSCMLLIEQLGMDCKDSVNLLKIRNAVCSFERLLELKNDHCEQLTRKNKELEDSVNGLQKELSQTKEIKLQLEQQKVEWEQERCSLRPAKKTSKEKKEIKKQINFTDDLDDLTPLSGTASEDCKLPCFDFRSCMLLIEQLGMDCKDSVNLLKIRNAVCSFERLLELKNDHCEQLTRKNKELEDSVNGLQKELSQTKEIKLQLEQQKVEWEQELCSLRFSFKREKEKRRNTDMLYEKNKEQLKRTVQQYNKEAELKQQLEVTLRTQDEELRSVRNNLNQLQEAQDRHAEAVRCIEKSKDHIQKPEVENAELKDRVKKQAGGIEELQENLLSTSSMVEERKRHESDKLAVSESIYAAAATGLIQQRASGKTDNHLCPIMEDEDSDGPAKKTSKEKKEIKKQINFTDDLDDLTPLSGTASEDCKLPCFDFRSCMLLIEQLGMDCKDSVNLLKIRNAVCSFERLLELKNDHCEQLTRKNKELEDSVNGLQKELSQTKEIKLQLEQQKVEWEQERCSLRFSFKREKEKRRNTDMLYEKNKEQLKRTVQQYNKEAELKQQLEVTLRTQDEELRSVRNNLNQLQEAQDRHAEAVRCIEKSKDHIQKPEVENAELKDRVKKQAGGIEELQENLLSTSSCDDKRGEMKKFIELKQSLEYCLDQEVKKNGQLEKEITRLKKLLSMTRSEVDDLTAKLETASSKCLQLDEKNQVLSQKLLSMKELQKKCEKLEKDKKKLEQQVVNLKSHAEVNMAEYSRIEQYKRELDKRARLDMEEKLREVNLFLQAQVASQESLGQLRDSNNALISSQMELRVKDLEFELSKMKSSQEHSNKTELEKYKELYFEEVKVRTSLTNELNRTNERLAEIRTKLLVEKQQKRNFLHTVTMSPVLELPYVRNISNRLPLDRHVAPRENVMIPPSSSWPSNNGIESYLLKVQQEFEKNISRELGEAAAEFESDSSYYTSSFF